MMTWTCDGDDCAADTAPDDPTWLAITVGDQTYHACPPHAAEVVNRAMEPVDVVRRAREV